jgi:hypothetical protein
LDDLLIDTADRDEGVVEFTFLVVGIRAASRYRRIVAVEVVEGSAT